MTHTLTKATSCKRCWGVSPCLPLTSHSPTTSRQTILMHHPHSHQPLRITHHLTPTQRHILTSHQFQHIHGHPSRTCHDIYHGLPGQNPSSHHYHHSWFPSPANRAHTTQPSQPQHLGQGIRKPFPNPLTQNMIFTVPIPKVHQTKGLTGRRT